MTESEPVIAGVRLERNGPVQWVDAAGFELSPGDEVIVLMDGDAGMRQGRVVIAPGQFVEKPAVVPAGKVRDIEHR